MGTGVGLSLGVAVGVGTGVEVGLGAGSVVEEAELMIPVRWRGSKAPRKRQP